MQYRFGTSNVLELKKHRYTFMKTLKRKYRTKIKPMFFEDRADSIKKEYTLEMRQVATALPQTLTVQSSHADSRNPLHLVGCRKSSQECSTYRSSVTHLLGKHSRASLSLCSTTSG